MLREHVGVINAGYRYGAATAQRMATFTTQLFAGGDDNALFLYPDQRLSADLQSLAGRIRAAEAKGELGTLQIPPSLLKRREELMEREKKRPEAMARFLETAKRRFANKAVYVSGIYGMVYDWAVNGLERGHRNVFARDSLLCCGGGMKGRVFPDNWRETIREFFGFSTFQETYQMSESMGIGVLCSEEKFHLTPTTVPFLLDPKTNKLLPRPRRHHGSIRLCGPDSRNLLGRNHHWR